MCIYIYIYIERERCMYVCICMYIYIYIYVYSSYRSYLGSEDMHLCYTVLCCTALCCIIIYHVLHYSMTLCGMISYHIIAHDLSYVGWHYLSDATLPNTVSVVSCVLRRVKDHHLLHDSPRLKKSCVRQVMLEKFALWVPLPWVAMIRPISVLRFWTSTGLTQA